jgi:hypothetical protein
MIERVPPKLASWVLERWGSPYHGESLAGDLIEQYQEGRSRAWYWRQVLAAINALMLAFGVIALGVGTLTWADTLRGDTSRPAACVCPDK